MKNSIKGLKSRFEQAEDRSFKPEDKSIEIYLSRKKKQKNQQSLRDLWDITKVINIYKMGVPNKREKEQKEYLIK